MTRRERTRFGTRSAAGRQKTLWLAAFRGVLTTALALSLSLLAGATEAATPLEARFDFVMPARFAIPAVSSPEGYEVYTSDETLLPDAWRVSFDACASSGEIQEYRWSIDDQLVASESRCDAFSHEFANEGVYSVTLNVVDSADGQNSQLRAVAVEDHLIIGIGDSYASGEGNPDNPLSLDLLDTLDEAEALRSAALAAKDAAFADLSVAGASLTGALEYLYAVLDPAYAELEQAIGQFDSSCPSLSLECAAAATQLAAATSRMAGLLPSLEASDIDIRDLASLRAVIGADASDARGDFDAAMPLWTEANGVYEAAEEAFLTQQIAATSAVEWRNADCHRSQFSGQVQAAKLLEEMDSHTSVTFVHLACTGATIATGVLGSYKDYPPQMDVVATLLDQREVDGLWVSIGGNDAGFGQVIEACIAGEPCWDDNPAVDPNVPLYLDLVCALAGPFWEDCASTFDDVAVNAKTLFDAGLAELARLDEDTPESDDDPGGYEEVQQRLQALGIPPARLFLTEYPDLTRYGTGDTDYCGWEPLQSPSEQLKNLPGFSVAEMEWADSYAATRLSQAMRDASLLHGWSFVSGIASKFRPHGYCADENWIIRIQDSFLIQADIKATAHPSQAGHLIYRDAIVAAFVPEPAAFIRSLAAVLSLALIARRRRGLRPS